MVMVAESDKLPGVSLVLFARCVPTEANPGKIREGFAPPKEIIVDAIACRITFNQKPGLLVRVQRANASDYYG
jgi:hypothetical protein